MLRFLFCTPPSAPLLTSHLDGVWYRTLDTFHRRIVTPHTRRQHGDHTNSSPGDVAASKNVSVQERAPRSRTASNPHTEPTTTPSNAPHARSTRHGAPEGSVNQSEHEPLPSPPDRLARDHPSIAPDPRQHPPGAPETPATTAKCLEVPRCELPTSVPARRQHRPESTADGQAAW